MKSVYLLTGLPGTGKTSLIKQVVSRIGDKAGGFYTEEIRLQGIRQGFRIVTLDGQSARLAHMNIRSPQRVSKYGVDIRELQTTGVAALEQAARTCEIVVIDEIGKMELFSVKFKTAVLEIIDSGKKVLGTIMLKFDPWADSIKHKPQVRLITVNRNNHPDVLAEIEKWIHNEA
jgi:nucleoside-triphosphatase